jgi:hypothetical protein
MGRDAERGEMNEDRRDLDSETAEQLLDGALPTRAAGTERLAALLAAAGGPPRPYEYAREEEAVMAFRALPAPARRPSWRKLLTFKVLAITATVTVGGLAFASTTGIIPGPFNDNPGVSPTNDPTWNSPERSHSSTGGSPTPEATSATAALSGLCTSYLAKDAEARRRTLDTPPYADLVTAAGGVDKVDAYCAALPEKEKEDKSKEPRPTHEPPAAQSHVPNPPRASRR